jgi:hypothetical protein
MPYQPKHCNLNKADDMTHSIGNCISLFKLLIKIKRKLLVHTSMTYGPSGPRKRKTYMYPNQQFPLDTNPHESLRCTVIRI